MRILFISWFILALANVEADSSLIPQKSQFGTIIRKAAAKLQSAASKRPLKISNMNNSLEKMAAAVRAMGAGQDVDVVVQILDDAKKDYRENHFATFLKAVAHRSHGDEEEANKFFEEFLLESQTYTGFEETFLKWGDFHLLRRGVYQYLGAQGISMEGKEKKVRARMPFEKLLQYSAGKGREDYTLNITFLISIAAGAIFFVCAFIVGMDFSKPFLNSLLWMYLACWIAYGFWVADLAFGLPFDWHRRQVVPTIFGSMATILILAHALSALLERRKPVETGYRQCPHCRSIIVELSVECLKCKRRL